jgi:hypothetical protein
VIHCHSPASINKSSFFKCSTNTLLPYVATDRNYSILAKKYTILLMYSVGAYMWEQVDKCFEENRMMINVTGLIFRISFKLWTLCFLMLWKKSTDDQQWVQWWFHRRSTHEIDPVYEQTEITFTIRKVFKKPNLLRITWSNHINNCSMKGFSDRWKIFNDIESQYLSRLVLRVKTVRSIRLIDSNFLVKFPTE